MFSKNHVKLVLFSLALAGSSGIAQAQTATKLPFHNWAAKPAMGWNSWDCFGTTVTEAQTKAQTDYMARNLKKFGWQYIVVDIQWYEPNSQGFDYRPGAPLEMDTWSRLQPAANKFPSAADGKGFKALADYVHSKGLKFGIHMMRGISRQAVEKNTPIKGTNYRAADIANKDSLCAWNPDMYGVDMSKPGAQAYYDSLYEMFAGWGVDFVKVDDLSAPYHKAEIEAIRKAIDKTKRPIVLSTSPGDTPVSEGAHVQDHANMWRVSGDFWDNWHALSEQFVRLNNWTPYRGTGHFPDADMLPLGAIRQVGGGKPWTEFTKDEQYTMMNLWSIARSPLMMGGDMTKNDEFTLSLLTNTEMLAVNQNSTNNRQLFNRNGLVAWVADVPKSKDKYLALFNARDERTLDTDKAAFLSPLITRNTAGHGVEVDADITGAKKLYLVVDKVDDFVADHFNWIEPRLAGPNGELKLTDLKWTSATSGWGQTTTAQAIGGGAMKIAGKAVPYGISTHADSMIEFDIPAGYTRFKAFAGLDEGGTNQPFGATVRASVFTRSPYIVETSAKVPVTMAELGFSSPVKIRDLWSKQEVGTFAANGTFAPEFQPHASGLYRVSPAK